MGCIRRRCAEERCRRRILFASDLTADELAGEMDALFNDKNPQYSSDSSEMVEVDDDDDGGHGYSDLDLAAVAAEAAELARDE